MKPRHPVDWRGQLPLALFILGACAFLAAITAIIISANSIAMPSN